MNCVGDMFLSKYQKHVMLIGSYAPLFHYCHVKSVHFKRQGRFIVANQDPIATCDNCASLFKETVRRFHCDHCQKYYYICPSCAVKGAHCRFCGIPLKRKSQPRR